MHVLLKPVNRAGATVLIRKGQQVRIGSTEWADYAVSGDPELLGIHFVVSFCDESPTVNAVDGAQIQLNGKPRTSGILRDGQQLQAGQTVFHVEVEGVEDDPSEKDDPSGRSPSKADEETVEPLELQPFDLDADLAALALRPLDVPPDDVGSVSAVVAAFMDADRHLDAVQFLGWVLPPVVNVQWLVESVQRLVTDLSIEEQRLLDAAGQWCLTSDAERLTEIRSLVETIADDGVLWWVAHALLWCPAAADPADDAPPPPRSMPPTASRGAITTLAYGTGQPDPSAAMVDCLTAGLAMTG
ncbi:MAG: FHA domain-containing protein [Planctomycetaceae bacterium]|nr:FHA domain-containing protein [Planctomycetaceae bacterium]